MEKHLNLFYSYNQGNLSSSERIKQLEDNLTRALIVTIKSLEISNQILFVKKLLKKDFVASKSFVFDLQNTNKYDKKSVSEKFIIVLQRSKSDFIANDFVNLRSSLLEHKTDNEKDELIKNIKKHLSSENEAEYFIENTPIKYSELNSILQLLARNRADAWVLGDKETLLFETKIGNNIVSKYQIYRHITGKNGFNLKSNEINSKVTIVNTTWEEISNDFLKLKETANERERFLISSFVEYISMTGQKLNLSYIINNEIDTEVHREQFSLFLNEIDKEIKKRKLPFERHNRAKAGLWEPYGMKISENEISKDPHYTIGFWESQLTISLTTQKKKQVNNDFLNFLENYFKQKTQTPKTLKRYSVSLKKYHLVDWKQGLQKGESDDSFEFYFEFSEIKSNFSAIAKIITELTNLKIYKQLDFSYQIRFFNFSKIRESNQESQIRYLNKQLLENPTELINEFVNFMEETQELYNLMRK